MRYNLLSITLLYRETSHRRIMCSQLWYKFADGSSSEYLCEHLSFHDAKGKSQETKRCWRKKTCKKGQTHACCIPGQKDSWKGWYSMQDFFLNTSKAADKQIKQSYQKSTCIFFNQAWIPNFLTRLGLSYSISRRRLYGNSYLPIFTFVYKNMPVPWYEGETSQILHVI